MKLSHIHEDDKPQADPPEVRIVVKNDIEEPPELDNPLDNIRDEFGDVRTKFPASILVEIWHNTKGKLKTYTGTFDIAGYDARYPQNLSEQCKIAHDAWYTMHYSKPKYIKYNVSDEYEGDVVFIRNDNQWLNRPMRSEFTLTWGHFMDIARRHVIWPFMSEKEHMAFQDR